MKIKNVALGFISILGVLAFTVSCEISTKSSDFYVSLPQEQLRVVKNDPPDGAVDISVYVHPYITFSADLDPSTLTNDSIFLTDPSNMKVPVGLVKDVRAVTLYPAALLDTGTTYTVHATTAVQDVGGNSLDSEFSSSFTTENP